MNLKYIRRAFIIIALLAIAAVPAYAHAAPAGTAKKLVVMPWKINAANAADLAYLSDAITEMLQTRSGGAAGVEPLGRDLVERAASRSGKGGMAGAAEAAKGLGADYALFGSVTIIGESVSLDASLLDVATERVGKRYSATGRGLDSVVELADRMGHEVARDLETAAGAAPAAPVAPAVAAPAPQAAPAPVTTLAPATLGVGIIVTGPKREAEAGLKWRSPDIDGLYTGMSAADLDGDGAKELFLLSARALTVAVLRPGRGLEQVSEIASMGQNVSVAAVDIDGDGKREVFLSRVDDNRPETVEVVYSSGAYATADKGIALLARARTATVGEAVLVGQGFRENGGFYGGIRRIIKKDGALIDGGPYGTALPKNSDLFRVDSFDLDGDGESETIALDTDNRLRVYESGRKGKLKQVHRSADHFGGTLNLIEVERDPASGETARLVGAEGRMTHMDTDGDGTLELIIRQNTPGGLGWYSKTPGGFNKGVVASLEWDGVTRSLAQRWQSREFTGYLADFLIDDIDGDGAPELTVLIGESGGGAEKLFGHRKSYVLSFEMSI